MFVSCSALEWQWLKAKRRVSVVFWSRETYSTDNLETRPSTIGKKLNSNVREDEQRRTVTLVVQTSDLLDNAAVVTLDGLETTVTPVYQVGLETTVTPAPLTLDLPGNVTPVMTDGFLRPVIRSVMDSAAVTMTTVRVVFRTEDGRDQ